MNYLTSQALKTPLIALGFIERWGGLTKRVTITKEGAANLVYPVSCDVSSPECYEPYSYTAIVPNSEYKSVAYFEPLGNTTLTSSAYKVSSPISLRLVVWLNFAKLGKIDCKSTDAYELAVYNVLKNDTAFDIDGIKGTVNIDSVTVLEKDPTLVFSPYSYNTKDPVFHRPYGFFGMDLNGTLIISEGCISDVSLGVEVDCVTDI